MLETMGDLRYQQYGYMEVCMYLLIYDDSTRHGVATEKQYCSIKF